MPEYPKMLTKNNISINTILLSNGTEIYNVNRLSKRVFHKHTDDCIDIIYHQHSGSAGKSYSNGCYTNKSTGESTYCGEWVRDDSAGGAYCSGCGAFSADCPGGYSHYETGGTVYTLGCGKIEGVTIDSYIILCGYETDEDLD